MENKKTALDWFVDQLPIRILNSYQEEIEKAKRMEMEQMEDIWITAHQAGRFEGKGIAEEDWQTFTKYYIENYGNKS